MDLYTVNSATTLHRQNAQSLEQQLERKRIAKERAAEFAATRTATPVIAHRRHFSLTALLRGRTRTAQ